MPRPNSDYPFDPQHYSADPHANSYDDYLDYYPARHVNINDAYQKYPVQITPNSLGCQQSCEPKQQQSYRDQWLSDLVHGHSELAATGGYARNTHQVEREMKKNQQRFLADEKAIVPHYFEEEAEQCYLEGEAKQRYLEEEAEQRYLEERAARKERHEKRKEEKARRHQEKLERQRRYDFRG